MNYIIPKVLWPEFQIDNSWIVEGTKDNYDNLYYHQFCSECGSYEIIKVGYYKQKNSSLDFTCKNCKNRDFISNTKLFPNALKYKLYYKETKNVHLIMAYINMPMNKNKEIYNTRVILFKYKFYKKDSVKLFNFFINKHFKTYIFYKNTSIDFVNSCLEKLSKKVKTTYIIPNRIDNFKKLKEQPYKIFEILSKKKNYIDFELNLLSYNVPYQTFDDYVKYLCGNFNTKSMKRIIYNYLNKNINGELTDPIQWPYIFCQSFEDINIIRHLLIRIDQVLEEFLVYEYREYDLIKSIKILKKYYDENRIKKLIISNCSSFVFEKFIEIGLDYKYDFSKIKCTSNDLYNHLSKVFCEQFTGSTKFNYSNWKLKKEIQIHDLIFKLPKDSDELFEWGESLNNCLVLYKSQILNGTDTIYGIFKNKKLVYAVNIVNNQIQEVSGKNNSSVRDEDLEIINKWSIS